jgi:hypothetical protein
LKLDIHIHVPTWAKGVAYAVLSAAFVLGPIYYPDQADGIREACVALAGIVGINLVDPHRGGKDSEEPEPVIKPDQPTYSG